MTDESQMPNVSSVKEPKCIVCETILCKDIEWFKTPCNHLFHKECIKGWIQASNDCPVCKKLCHIRDLCNLSLQEKEKYIKKYRKKKNKQQISDSQQSSVIIQNPTENTIVTVDDCISECSETSDNDKIENPSQLNSQAIDYNIIKRMIEESFQQMITNFSFNQPTTSTQILPLNNFSNSNSNSNQSNNVDLRQTTRNYSLSPDKITNIIQNWHLKFDGSSNGMRSTEFIYRVKALTQECFNGNFSAICSNLNILLAGKAREWYWRYHKKVDYIEWEPFCKALCYQYKDHKTDSDIREEISLCKQKPGESFETYFDNITAIADKLTIPMPETELIERTIRNLRSDIRHELLYVQVDSIAQLRKLCYMRENFFNEEAQKRSFINRTSPNSFVPRKNISAFSSSENNLIEENISSSKDISVDAIQQNAKFEITCFNCDEPGHRWDMCLKERSIFCYGCGAKNVYKPQCSICMAKRSENFQRGPFSANRMEPK